MDSNTQHIAPTASNRQYIARNNCYSLSVDKTKNRVYYSILGFWKNKESIPGFLADWDKVLQLATPGFGLVVDMRTMITHPQQLNVLHQEALKKVITAGAGKVANVMPHDKIASLQAAEIIARVGLTSQNFDSCEEGEQWLDEMMG